MYKYDTYVYIYTYIYIYMYIYIYIYAYIPRVGWVNLGERGELGHFRLWLISLKQNGLTAGAA